VLVHGNEAFPGAEDSDDDEQVVFTLQYPEDERRIRRLMAALAQILAAAEEQPRAS
jgi:hypothetical protein